MRGAQRRTSRMDLHQALQAWHDFYVVIAAASGTLLGAMFVVVSIATGFLTGERARLASFWMTPTVVNVTAVMIGCAVLLTPLLTWELLGALLGCASLSGLLYAAIIGREIWRRRFDLDDRIWHGLMPPLGCAIVGAASVLAVLHHESSLAVLAAALLVLLVAAIRNAWDLIVFFVSRERG
jgi:hypothetical protein